MSECEGEQEEEVERVYVWGEGTYVNVRVWVCGCDTIFHWFIFVIFPSRGRRKIGMNGSDSGRHFKWSPRNPNQDW